MKIELLENQVELLKDSLRFYASEHRNKQEIIYYTYESLNEQLLKFKEINALNENKKIYKIFLKKY